MQETLKINSWTYACMNAFNSHIFSPQIQNALNSLCCCCAHCTHFYSSICYWWWSLLFIDEWVHHSHNLYLKRENEMNSDVYLTMHFAIWYHFISKTNATNIICNNNIHIEFSLWIICSTFTIFINVTPQQQHTRTQRFHIYISLNTKNRRKKSLLFILLAQNIVII